MVKKISITKKLIDKYKYCKVRDDIDLERIEGGFIFSLPLIFSGLIAAGTIAGATAGGIKAANDKKADEVTAAADAKKAAEQRRHNLKMEKLAEGSGVGEMIGTMKEFGKRFSEETKKTVKQGLKKLVDSIDIGEIKVIRKYFLITQCSCICGSSGSGKTQLTSNMFTTPNLLDFDSLYIYTTTPEQSYYQFLKTLEYLPKRDVHDLFQYYKENEEKVELKDFIDNYIEGKKPTDIKVFLTKNVNDLDLSSERT
ncbi:hypothetical protein LOTGIDRAFT_163789 [Lottia gigantea]|uniref:Uncharacterized protein n=1 Tax=Lottia gigantea TaxID=225164 RepID=V4AC88_LOTGI|nr:hypothetical protein LOTGIDRAFT_163789 [Lottia gigantea]ESO90901.1 hypothetical protein LOTGIDRAFT_163789 [Lottia gigantea]